MTQKSGAIITDTSDSGNGAEARDTTSLEAAVKEVASVVIYSHVNPDPDTVGAAVGLAHLLRTRFGKTVGLCYRGIVGRAENQQLLRLAAPELMHARDLDQDRYEGSFLLDAQPDYGYLPELDRVPLIGIIDHHPRTGAHAAVPFQDIRSEYGATSTIITEYLRAEEIEPPTAVATALYYGIKTDTLDLSRRTSAADVEAFEWLAKRIDREMLGRIENPPLSREYFETMVAALTRAVTYEHTVLTEVGEMPYPDMVAEVADRLMSLDGAYWSVCFGMHDQRIYFSVRSRHQRLDAGDVVKEVLRGEGVGGGHDAMAAGRVQLLEESEETYTRVVTDLWNRFLEVLGEDAEGSRRLVTGADVGQRIVPAE